MNKLQDLKGAGRPKAAIDLAEVEKLAVLHATDQEIADWFAVTRSTITRRKAESKKFRQAVERGRSRGRVSLRRLQFEAAQNHNPAMLIWLGKQWLHQQQTVGVQGDGPEKSLLPDWLERMFKAQDEDQQEAPGQNPDGQQAVLEGDGHSFTEISRERLKEAA